MLGPRRQGIIRVGRDIQNVDPLAAWRADLDIARATFNRLANGPTKEELDGLLNSVTIASLERLASELAPMIASSLTTYAYCSFG